MEGSGHLIFLLHSASRIFKFFEFLKFRTTATNLLWLKRAAFSFLPVPSQVGMPSTKGERQSSQRQRFFESPTPRPESALSPSSLESTPHPYHNIPSASLPPAPQSFSRFDGRASSLNSHVSDISMDDQSGTHESIFEYSDTSGEEREDAYFLPRQSRGRVKAMLDDKGSRVLGESAFRSMYSGGEKSSRVMQYTSDGSLRAPSDHEYKYDGLQVSSTPSHHEALTKNADLKKWMTSLAYSFRSPMINHHKAATPQGAKHRSQPSWGTMEYPTTQLTPLRDSSLNYYNSTSFFSKHGTDLSEKAPLVQQEMKSQSDYGSDINSGDRPMGGNTGDNSERAKRESKPRHITLKSKSTAATIAAFFLMDYEAGRPPTLPSKFETITTQQLQIYQVHFSLAWRLFGIALPTVVLFLAHSQNNLVTALMHSFVIASFLVEVWMREQLYAQEISNDEYHSERRLNRPLVLFFIVLGLESWIWYIFPPDPLAKVPALVSSVFKPIVFFYISLKARHALEGLSMISRIVVRVILIEMMLILAFAAVACQLFRDYDSFKDLSSSWLSLFERKCTKEFFWIIFIGAFVSKMFLF